MKNVIAAAALSLVLSDFTYAHEQRDEAMMKITPSTLADADIQAVSPALARFGREAISNDLWQRDALSARDRSIVTVAMLIARNQPGELKHYIAVALDSGVTPAEVSEIITHLAFYAGWPNAMSAVSVAKTIFEARGVTAEALPAASPTLLPLNEQVEKRADTVEKNVGPGFAWPGWYADRCFSTSQQQPRLRPATEVTGDGQRVNRRRTERADWLPPKQTMDNGLSAQRGRRSSRQAAFTRGMAKCVYRRPGGR